MDINFPLFAGIIAAVAHVIAGPDHLAAVTPFAIESKRKAWKVGLYWAIGHISGMLFIGLLFLFFKDFIPIERISKHSELLVGIVLIVLGIWIFVKLFRKEKVHGHMHVHSDGEPVVHQHKHHHNQGFDHHHEHTKIKRGNLASLYVGFIHGLAGIAHFVLLLPVLGFENEMASVLYLGGFAVGTLVAMISFAFLMGRIAATVSKEDHHSNLFKGLKLASGLLALIIGVYWVMLNFN